MRRCERLLTGGSEPCEVIFTEHVRKIGRNVVSIPTVRLWILHRIGVIQPLFSEETRNARNGVESDRAPISQIALSVSYIYI